MMFDVIRLSNNGGADAYKLSVPAKSCARLSQWRNAILIYVTVANSFILEHAFFVTKLITLLRSQFLSNRAFSCNRVYLEFCLLITFLVCTCSEPTGQTLEWTGPVR